MLLQIHTYVTAVYLRVASLQSTHINLIFSKMRLTPANTGKQNGKRSKQLTIPRLELFAVLIGVQATMFVTGELKLHVLKRIF